MRTPGPWLPVVKTGIPLPAGNDGLVEARVAGMNQELLNL